MAEFNLRIGINAGPARRGSAEVSRALRDIDRSAQQSNRSLSAVDKQLRVVARSASVLSAAASAIASAFAVREFFRIADEYQELNARIRLATDTSEEFRSVQEELFAIADRTAAPIREIGLLYSRSALAADELGLSQRDLLDLTEAVGNSLRVSGVSAAQAQGALIQLSQALGEGVVRAQEFNSLIENARPLLQGAAEQLGTTVSGLRRLVLEGELSSEVFARAIIDSREGLEDLASGFNTVGGASTRVGNAIVQVVGEFAEQSRITDLAIGTLNTFASVLRGPVTSALDVVAEFVSGIITSVQLFGEATGLVLARLQIRATTLREALGRALSGDFSGALEAFEEQESQFARLDDIFQQRVTQILGLQEKLDQAAADARATAARATGADSTEEGGVDTGSFEERLKAVQDANADLISSVEEGRRVFEATRTPVEEYNDRLDRLAELFNVGAINAETLVRAVDDAAERLAAQTAEEEVEDLAQKYAVLLDQVERGRRIFEETRTPAEVYNETLRDLTELVNAGAISYDTFNRAVAQAFETLQGADTDEATEQFQFLRDVGRAAAEDIQGAFVDLFLTAGQGLDDFADQFGQTLQRLAANFLANQAIQFLANAGGSFGGPLGAVLQGFGNFAGSFGDGGRIPSGQFGLVGERGQPEFVSGPATVTPMAQVAQAAPAVTVVNVTDPREALAALATAEGDQAIVNVISRNRAAIQRELGQA